MRRQTQMMLPLVAGAKAEPMGWQWGAPRWRVTLRGGFVFEGMNARSVAEVEQMQPKVDARTGEWAGPR